MSNPRVVLEDSQERRLRAHLESHPLGHERAAIVLFRRLHCSVEGFVDSDRYLAIETIPFEEVWITSSSSSHIGFELKHFRELFRRCEEDSLVFGFVHNHPAGFPDFSVVDEENERTLLDAISNRNGSDVHLVALLWTNQRWKARIRHGKSPTVTKPVRHILTLGRPLRMYGIADDLVEDDHQLARQAAAFGHPFVRQLQSLRIGVVGAGGTGSPTITLLARAGVGELVIIDGDELEKSNLNRVRGATARDVGKNKALIAKEFVTSLSLGTRVVAIPSQVDADPAAVDALATCDVVFGCTDDQIGRELLNTALYVYAQPYIDIGLGGQVAEDPSGHPYLRYHYGRVSTILPEHGECLFCQDVLREIWIRHQYALRENPRMRASEARERYLEGGGEQAPGVGPFTSAIADFGVATLFDLIRPFRKFPPELRNDFFTVDFVKMELRSRERRSDPNCPYCNKREYLLLSEKYRLNRPMLGKRHAAI